MLSYALNGNILEVTETLHGYSPTRITYWYYDIKNWKKSSHGKKNDVPDREMSVNDIYWVKKYYLPKVEKS